MFSRSRRRGAEPDVVLYVRASCHLCHDARTVVAAECEARGIGWREVDVDTDPALVERHGELVPVVEVDGVRVGYWHVDAARLRRAIDR